MYFVYVLKSSISNRFYKGVTSNIDRRVKEHNSGKTKSTKPYKPWKLVYFEEFDSFHEASKREIYFKSGSGREHLKDILDS